MRNGIRRRCLNFWVTVIVLVVVLSIVFKAQAADVDGPKWDVKALLVQYNCKWINEKRKEHSDDELEAMARQLHLPEIVITMAKRCPK
jgi:hypothetical protein